MRGQISNINMQTNQGMIVGEDGQQYAFNLQANNLSAMTKEGEYVEFSIDNNGFAHNIQPSLNNQQMFNNIQGSNPVTNMTNIQSNNAVLATEENYGMVDWVKKCLRNYANFNGRARRKEYWYFSLAMTVMYIIAAILDRILTKGFLGGILGLAFFLPSLAVMVRRLHDINKSGWYALVAFIPLIGALLLIYWEVTDTYPHTNQWGAPARPI